MRTTQAARLRELLRDDGMVVAPGAYDAITARVIAQAGFPAVYMTGAGTAASLGYPDFVVIARTDARAVAGFDEAVARANLALQAGADMAFFEAPQTLDEVAQVPRLVQGPCLLNVVRGGKTPEIRLEDAQVMGYRVAIVPGLLLKTVLGACDAALAELRRTGVHPVPQGDPTVRQAFNRFGADEWDAFRTRFREAAE